MADEKLIAKEDTNTVVREQTQEERNILWNLHKILKEIKIPSKILYGSLFIGGREDYLLNCLQVWYDKDKDWVHYHMTQKTTGWCTFENNYERTIDWLMEAFKACRPEEFKTFNYKTYY